MRKILSSLLMVAATSANAEQLYTYEHALHCNNESMLMDGVIRQKRQGMSKDDMIALAKSHTDNYTQDALEYINFVYDIKWIITPEEQVKYDDFVFRACMLGSDQK
jgi:hypothetical protein